MSNKLETKKLLALILMLFPIISIIGFLLYILGTKITGKELIVAILTIPFGFLAGIFLWLNALGFIKL
ncbi:MAG: hypothetical protein ACRCRP_02725 [Metamycoplasmataceae bacterium]